VQPLEGPEWSEATRRLRRAQYWHSTAATAAAAAAAPPEWGALLRDRAQAHFISQRASPYRPFRFGQCKPQMSTSCAKCAGRCAAPPRRSCGPRRRACNAACPARKRRPFSPWRRCCRPRTECGPSWPRRQPRPARCAGFWMPRRRCLLSWSAGWAAPRRGSAAKVQTPPQRHRKWALSQLTDEDACVRCCGAARAGQRP